MTVTENYMLQQMQQMAASMNTLPQTGNGTDKTGEGGSFQEMLDQVGSSNTETAPAKETESRENDKTAGNRDSSKETESAGDEKTPAAKGEKKEELKPETMTANPNAAGLADLFRPEIVEAEAVETAVPVEAIPQEAVEEPAMDLSGQAPAMEAEAETGEQPELETADRTGDFRQTLEETQPRQRQQAAEEETAAAPEKPVETAPEQVEKADKPRQEAPEVEKFTGQDETDGKPQAEAVETEQPVFRETESAPVKVGEPYETVDAEKPDMEEKLSENIRTAIQSGAERVEIRLAPQSLGSLTIEMTRDANGALQVVLHASNSKAAGVLNQHLDGLYAALRGYGQEEVRLEVQRNDEAQQQNFRQADPDGHGQQHGRQQEQRREEEHSGDDFMQKLRLGLLGTDGV